MKNNIYNQKIKRNKTTKIQKNNQKKVLDAALEIFSRHGYKGSTINQISTLAGMSKANLLYYFNNKQILYLAVLNRTLETWLESLEDLDPKGVPLDELWNYINQKLNVSKIMQNESRLFAMEIIQGAPILKEIIQTNLKKRIDKSTKLIDKWIKAKKIAPVDPLHLLFVIWAMTQTYADFWTQIEILSSDRKNPDKIFKKAKFTIKQLVINGLQP